tara:strand:+ start:232 stop:465 length:234 start_codon:yes stop_codon:yes gene_type:complete
MNDNKIIAEFMGKEIYQKHHESNYHTSWDWLMPVVKKVIQEDYDFLVFEELKYHLWRVDIDAVYSTVVEFIKFNRDE